MNKTINQGLLIIASFFLLWYALKCVNWIDLFKIEETSISIEEKLGELYLETFKNTEIVITDKTITLPIDSVLTKICKYNDIDKSQIKLHILKNSNINAFALPDKHIIIYSGLINATNNESELAGVISHELAHIQLNHVMKKLIKEIGLTVLVSMTTGNGNTDIIRKTTSLLSTKAFDRQFEEDADFKAIDYLVKSEINPEGLANFLYQLASVKSEFEFNLTWINSHPDSKKRAEYIINYFTDKSLIINPILSKNTWIKLKHSL